MASNTQLFHIVSYILRYIFTRKMLALVSAWLTWKTLPFAWTIRIAYGYWGHYVYDYYTKHRPLPPSTPQSLILFQPTIYTTSNPLGECDFNIHKSNSTYLTDLDVARGYHIYTVLRRGFDAYMARSKSEKNGLFYEALGGVEITFKKEIKPWTRYEIWTRVLSWDEKWLYLISHFVKEGAVRPTRYTDQPWKSAQESNRRKDPAKDTSAQDKDKAQPIVYATAISKLVFKQGRRTVRPEDFLHVCGFLDAPSDSQGSSGGVSGRVGQYASTDAGLGAAIERRRQEGVVLAQHMAGMDSATAYFSGDEDVALARY